MKSLWEENKIYRGQLVKGQKEGRGKLESIEGTYEGFWKESKRYHLEFLKPKAWKRNFQAA
jgi:hypothetical protein